MTMTLVLRFPRGRYRAVPWGRSEHEGVVDLPPSPWRVLRALYAVWRTRAPDLDEDTVHGLLARLAVPPTCHVPRHGVRQDSFAVFERGAELGVCWPVELSAAQHAALRRLAGSIPYFGRADSACEGFLADGWEPGPHETWVPLDVADSVADNAAVTSVLAPDLPLRIDSLLARPVDVRKGGLLFPAGTHLLGYQRVAAVPGRARQRRRRGGPVTAVRFSVRQAGLPPQTDALIYTDLLRQGALSKLARLPGERIATQLGGCTADDRPLAGHEHAHYLPLLTDQRLTGLVVWAPGELPEDEMKALTDVDRLYTPTNPNWRLTIRVSGIGAPAQVAPELVGEHPARVWQSVTPFTPSRYPKRNADWQGFLHAEVARELESRRLPPPRAVTVLDGDWSAWRRYRPTARMRRDPRQGQVSRPSAFLRVELSDPVPGPLSLGHLSHFGLGLFSSRSSR